MKNIIILFVLLSSSVAYAGEPYVKTFNKGKNWTVLEVGMAGEFKQCSLRSAPSYLDNGRNPKYGTTFLEVSYPSNNITFSGDNIGAYFKISKQSTLQVDDGPSTFMVPEKPMPGKTIIDSMKKGRTAKITVDFGSGPPGIHTFSLLGFSAAYNMLQDCSGIAPAKQTTEVKSHSIVSKATLTLDSFLESKFAKQYGISKQDGWALRDGSFNNELSVSRLQGAMLSASTKKGNIVEAGVMFLGNSSLDTSKMSFVLALLKALDSNTAQLHIKDSISKSLSNRVSQIKQAPAQTYGNLRVHAANVGGDAVISIELQ
ncbi:MAG: hypothetical protein RBR67_18025 [Desulfobacterium sp.]|nr:hypothetical protein [Desulfobacterium sp.]